MPLTFDDSLFARGNQLTRMLDTVRHISLLAMKYKLFSLEATGTLGCYRISD